MALLKYLIILLLLISPASANVLISYVPSDTTGSTWANPNNIFVDDGVYALTLTSGTKIFARNFNTDNLTHRKYNITDVSVRLVDILSDSGVKTATVSVTWDGGTTWATNQTVNFVTAENFAELFFTDATDWDTSKLSNSNFFVQINYTSPTSAAFVYIDQVRLRVEIEAEAGNWTLDQATGNYANDSSGLNNNGTITGATWTTDNVSATALNFDGSGDYVTVPANESLNLTSSFTAETWFKVEDLTHSNALISKTIGGAVNTQYQLYTENLAGFDDRLVFSLIKNTGINTAFSDIPVSNNTWYYAQATWDGATMRLYVNGILQAQTTAVTAPIDGGSGQTYIGALAPGTYEAAGKIDEVKIYNYALNSSERTADYQQFHPVPAYPTGGMTVFATYPPQTTTINFSWHDSEYPADEIIVAKDAGFNIIVVDDFVSTDYKVATLDSGDTYYWKVRQYNGTTATYGDTSQTENFTITSASSSAGQGVQGVVYELVNGLITPISEANVYIYNSTFSDFTTTGSNGYYLFDTLGNGTYNIYAVKQDYDTTATLPVNVNGSLATQDILMNRFISQYVPNFVYEKFIVRGLFDNSYPDVTVNIYIGDSQAISFTGTTDSMGQAVFRLVKDQKYRVVFTGGGIGSDITITMYAKEESYYVRVLSGFPTGGDRNSDITSNLTTSVINSTWSNLSLIYNDTTSTTSQIWLYVRNLTTNQTVCYQSSTSQTAYLNCSVYATGSYQFGYNATTSKYGFVKQDKIINFDVGKPATPFIDTNIDQTLLQWASIILIVLTAALFSVKTVKFGAVIVPLEALVLWAIGGFEPAGGNAVTSFLLLSCAVCLGIMVYLRQSETKVAYS